MDSTTHTTTTVEFVDWRTKAKEKLEAEDKLFKGGRAAASVQSYVLRALLNFADQEPRFAEVVCNTERTFSECCAAVVHNAGEVLSDLEAYRKAVQFYFPNAEISFSIPAIRSKGYGPQGHSFGASRRGMESGFAAIWCISISEIIGQNRNFTAVESGGRTERPSSSGNATGAKKLSISCASARSCPRCCWPPLARISRTLWHPTLTNLRVMFGKC